MAQIAPDGQAQAPHVVVAWDPASSRTWTSLQAFIAAAPPEVVVHTPGFEPSPGDLLDDHLVAPMLHADAVVLVGSFDNPLLTGFQAGLIQALFKRPAAVAGLTDDDKQVASLCTGRKASRFDDPEALWQEVMPALGAKRAPVPQPPREESAHVVLYPAGPTRGDPVLARLRSSPMRVVSAKRGARPRTMPLPRSMPLRLTWVIRDLALDFQAHEWTGLEANLFNAVYAGWYYACDARLGADSARSLRILRDTGTPPVRELARFEQVFDSDATLLGLLDLGPIAQPEPVVLERLTLVDFKSFKRLTIDLARDSTLAGNWTCVAGINGSGKTSVLQAACLVLLGRRAASELGSERLARMMRVTRRGRRPRAEIRAVLREGHDRRELVLPLDERGIDEKALYADAAAGSADRLWERLESELLVAYGATRNVSEYMDTRNANMSPRVRRQMTLFDALTQVAGVEALLSGGATWQAALGTLSRILDVVLEANEVGLKAVVEGERLLFRQDATELEVVQLPDGFRSLVAWLGDLCVAWHDVTGRSVQADPSEIRGIVLLDEIDLHLHASLQRTIVPALRRALPNVQWIVTTHSPLILSSFDRRELVLLDREEEDGIREIDRQILAFTTDEIYEWLMGTPASSGALDEKLADAPEDEAVAVLMLQSKDRDETEARKQLERTRELVARLTPEEGPEQKP